MKSKLLGVFRLDNALSDKSFIPMKLYIFNDKIEIEMWKMKSDKNTKLAIKLGCTVFGILKVVHKKFDYSDMILMNETLNKIQRPKK